MPVKSAGDNLAVVAYAVSVGEQRKRRIHQIVQVDQFAADFFS